MKSINITLLVVALSLVVFSCSKEEETIQDTDPIVQDSSPDLTESEFNEILAGTDNKTWTASSFTLANMSQSCRLDDVFIFNVDHTYAYNGGDDLCGDEDNTTQKSGTWSVDAENNLIIFDQNTPSSYEAIIVKASENELELSGSYLSLTVKGKYTN